LTKECSIASFTHVPVHLRSECKDIIISIDTRHSSVAKAAIEAGADIVNDVSGGTHDPLMLSSVAAMGVPMILMHMRGNPKTMQSLTNYSENNGVVPTVARDLMHRSAAAEAAGIHRWLQVLDPGIGFAKDLHDNLSLLKGSNVLRRSCNNMPFLFGPSRKGFIGKITGEEDPSKRDYGTIAACLGVLQQSSNDDCEPCTILRVHNVKAAKQAVMIHEAIQNAN
jgi:2-amino-4-hydroxy-6-hydroxymethyldihydropteridine diphosphokinase/dihydropteroate synthase